jgi:hypothetical protein
MRGVYRSCSGSFNPDLGNEEKEATGYRLASTNF